MTDNTPSLFVNKSTWETMKDQASVLVKSSLLPSWITKPEAAIAIMLKGHEVRIPPMQALAHMSFINGRVALSAELMLALIYRDCPEAVISLVKFENDGCVIMAARSNKHALTKFSFTIEDAVTAKLSGKDNWQNYPKAMCKARTIADMARTIFPDKIMGCSYTREELSPDEPLTIDLETIDIKEVNSSPVDQKNQTIEEIRLLTSIMIDEEKSKTILETLEKNKDIASLEWYETVKDKVKSIVEEQLNT